MRLFLVGLAAFVLLAAPAAAQTQPVDTTPTITADGVGSATLTPDVADFAAGVSRAAPTSRGARDAANRRMAAVLRAVKAGGVAEADIRTVGLTIQRQRVGKRKRVRYRAEQTILIHVRTVSTLASLIDAVADAGADQISDPDFGFADPSNGRTLATRAALADARRRADDAAAVAGLRITGVRSVNLDPDSDGGCCSDSGASTGAGAEKSPSTQVLPGTQDFTERVRVVYTAAPTT
ncbi:SIMPL domain-containing protein [Solirubrobacter soli]|uniref:SIMPL domain-containing protein n=1 Tax=Solirubrobacter soli TaxID=363832 RepID=UPI00040658C1|nr:SIMPL domain-containing protein [Solirubrobacter soli]